MGNKSSTTSVTGPTHFAHPMDPNLARILAKLPPLRRISLYLWLFGSAMVLSMLMLTPGLAVLAVRENEVASSGVTISGRVIAHESQNQGGTVGHVATVQYEVANRTYMATIEGAGAENLRLPIGTKLPVRYHPKFPNFSMITIQDASTSRAPPLALVFLMWLIPISFFILAWVLGRIARKIQLPADSDLEVTPYVYSTFRSGESGD